MYLVLVMIKGAHVTAILLRKLFLIMTYSRLRDFFFKHTTQHIGMVYTNITTHTMFGMTSKPLMMSANHM